MVLLLYNKPPRSQKSHLQVAQQDFYPSSCPVSTYTQATDLIFLFGNLTTIRHFMITAGHDYTVHNVTDYFQVNYYHEYKSI